MTTEPNKSPAGSLLVVASIAVAALVGVTWIGGTGAGGAAAGEPFQVCLSQDMDLVGIAAGSCWQIHELGSLMDKPISKSAGVQLELTSPQSMTERAAIVSCRDYVQRVEAGWYAMTSRDMAVEASFKSACGVISAVAAARQARISYLARSDGLADIHLLGEEMLPSFGGAAVRKRPRTLAEMARDGDCQILEANRRTLRLSYDNTIVVYRLLAVADFDGDGYEDMLVTEGVRAEGGTAQFSNVIALTRRSSRSRYELIVVEGLNP